MREEGEGGVAVATAASIDSSSSSVSIGGVGCRDTMKCDNNHMSPSSALK